MIFAMWVGYTAVLGAVLASFACVVSERRAAGEAWAKGRSACACGRPLRWFENIPIFGWVATGGVARCCGAQLPGWYLKAELIGAGVGGVVGVSAWAVADGAGPVAGAVAGAVGLGGLLATLIAATRELPDR